MPQLAVHKKSANLWFRMVVPARLRARIGKTEIKLSLGTANSTEAKIRHAALQTEWRQRFLALDREHEADSLALAPQLVEQTLARFSGAQRRDDTVLAMMKMLSFRIVTSWGRDFYERSEADYAFGGMPDEESWAEPDIEMDVVPAHQRFKHVAAVTAFERSPGTQGMGHRLAVLSLLKAQRWDLLGPEIMLMEAITGVTIARGTTLYTAVAAAFLTALADHEFATWTEGSMAAFRAEVPVEAQPVAAVFPSPPPIVTATLAPTGKAATPLSKALQIWREMQQPAKQSDLEVSRAVNRFIELFGDKAIGSITEDDIYSYRDLIQKMPANLQIKKIHAAQKTLKQVIEEARPEVRRLSPTSVKKDLGGLQAIMSVAKAERMIKVNVAAEVKVAGFSKTRHGKRKARLPFTPAMMTKLFSSPIFVGCAGPRDFQRCQAGSLIYQDEMYWSFLLGALSGARLEEMGQVRLEDIEEIDLRNTYGRRWSGVRTVIYITGSGPFQSTKTEGSMRVLIVHPRLAELGFLDYIKSRREAGADRLFDLKLSTSEKWTKELSRRLNRYIDEIVTKNKLYTFHSSRHEFKDRADDSDISEKSNDRLTGHTNGSVGRKYGIGPSIAKLSAEMDKLNTSFVDWTALRAAVDRK